MKTDGVAPKALLYTPATDPPARGVIEKYRSVKARGRSNLRRLCVESTQLDIQTQAEDDEEEDERGAARRDSFFLASENVANSFVTAVASQSLDPSFTPAKRRSILRPMEGIPRESQEATHPASVDSERSASGRSVSARIRSGMTRHLIVLGAVALAGTLIPAVLLFMVFLRIREGWALVFSGAFLFYAVLAIASVLSDAYKRGSRIRTRPILREWAKPHGWGYDPSPPIEDDSPLGYPMGIANAFWGRVLGSPGMIYELPHFSDEQLASGLPGYLVVRLELPARGIAAIQLRYRVHGDKPLMDSTYREIELESVEFNRVFRLEAGPAVSEVELRRLFDPETITFFLQSGADRLPPGFRLALENGVFFYITRGWVRPDTLAEIEKMLTQIEPFVRHLQALASARALS